MSDFYTDKTIEILSKIHYATLATVSASGDPFNAPVFYAYDNEMNLYWSSSVHSQHSINIRDNGKVYVSIYDSTVAQGTGWGVYMQAEAEEVVSHDEVNKVIARLGNRRRKSFKKDFNNFLEGSQRIYKARPLNMWINDAKQDANGEYIEDYRVPVGISNFTKVCSDQ